MDLQNADTVTTATAIRAGEITAKAAVSAALERISTHNKTFNCFTAVTDRKSVV